MPDILLLSADPKATHEIEEFAAKRGLRVKSVFDVGGAIEWLKLRRFEAAFVDSTVSIEDQQSIGDALWRKDVSSILMIFDFSGVKNAKAASVRLYGAEIASGFDAKDQIEKCLDQIQVGVPDSKKATKILVVEDLDSPRDIICSFIEAKGFTNVHGVSSAEIALKELRERPEEYACVISDIRMPNMNGKEFVEVVRNSKEINRVPIIMLTAYGSVDMLVDCLKSGASGFLIKPPKIADLHREIGRAFRMRARSMDPRLATIDEAEGLREALIEKGFS